MLKIEYKNKVKGSVHDNQYLVVDGLEDKYSSYSSSVYPSAHFYNSEVINKLCSYCFTEVGKNLTSISFTKDIDCWEDWIDITIYCNHVSYRDYYPAIRTRLVIQDWEKWSKPWSMADVAKKFEENIILLNNELVRYFQEDEESMLNGFGIEYFPKNDSEIIQKELDYIIPIIEDLVEKTKNDLLLSLDDDSVSTLFQFPSEIAAASKQYLVYFAQFLADIGIDADTEIKEEANQTLFKVTPKDKTESLEQIRQALAVYLDIPNHPDLIVQDDAQNNIAISQLQSNVFHLKSQLALATSVLQAKEATIEALQLSNYQLKQLVDGQTKKEENKEDLIKDVVSVDKYENKGVSINLAEILRRLKRTIGK